MTAQEQVEHRNLVIEEKEMEGKERTPPAPEASNLREEFQKGAGKEDSRNKSFAPRDERNRLTLFVLSAMSAFFFVGATLGFGPMQLMLEDNGSYAKECTEQERREGIICEEQRVKLVNMALLIPSMQLLSPFLGRFVDAFGPKITAYCQESLGVLGISILIVAVKTLADPLLYVGFAAMSLSTWLGSLLIVQIGLYFKGHTISRVIFILNNVFSSGAIVFLFLWLISKSFSESSNAAAITLGGYLVFALLLYGISAYFWSVTKPALSEDELSVFVSTRSLVSSRESFQISHRFSVSSAVLLGGLDASRHGGSGQLSRRISSEKSFRKSLSHQPTQKTGDNISERLESALDTLDLAPADTSPGKREYISVADRKPEDQLLSIPFLCHCIFFGLHVAMCNWNTATQKDFLEDLGDDEADNLYLTIFTLLAPASVLGSPFIDKAILKFGWTAALHSVNVLAVAYMTVKVASTSLDVQILGFIIFMFYRSFLFGISFSFVPVLMNATVVGRAAGAMAGCAGLASCMAIPLIRLALKSDGGFLVPNAVLLSLCLPTTAAVCVVSHYLQLEIAAKEVAEEDPKAATA